MIVPVPKVFGSTGQLHLGYVGSVPSPVTGTSGVHSTELLNVSVIAGSSQVAKAGYANLTNAARNDLFALFFSSVTFSGTQFRLYLSTNGFSQINTTAGETQDVLYGPTFNTADFAHSPMLSLGGGYYIGSNATYPSIVVGPIPVHISNAYKYVKVFDGNSGAVAVSHETLVVLPGLTVSPKNGPAGADLTLTGGGFPAGKTIDILYQFTWTDWEGVPHTPAIKNLTTGVSTGQGFFSVSVNAPDTKQAVNPLVAGPQPNTLVNFFAKQEAAPHALYAVATFTEWPRFISSAFSYDNTGAIVASAPFTSTNFYGNDSGTTGAVTINGVSGSVANIPNLNANVLGSLGVSGNFSYAGSTVSLWIGSTNIKNATADTNGNFVVNGTIPVLSEGLHTVSVQSNGVTYNFKINVLPTLILTPSHGPIGTMVTATAYGFPSNSWVSLWWNRHVANGANNDYYLVNATIATTGSFNSTVTFIVPNAYGGSHNVDATTDKHPSPILRSTLTAGPGYIASASFKITPQLSISSNSFPDDGSLITITGTGLVPAYLSSGCAFTCIYQVLIDNSYAVQSTQAYETGGVAANVSGDMVVTFVAAGFRPGLHVFALMGPAPPCVAGSSCASVVPTTPAAYITFTVTTAGDPISDQITALGTTISGLSSSLASIQTSLTGIQTSLTNFQSSLSTITSDVSGLGAQLTSIQSSLSTITSDVSGLGSQLTSIQSSLTSITSTLNAAAASASTAATQATAAATAATNASSGNSTAQTYVLVVAVLAAITLVLELAILVRKLS